MQNVECNAGLFFFLSANADSLDRSNWSFRNTYICWLVENKPSLEYVNFINLSFCCQNRLGLYDEGGCSFLVILYQTQGMKYWQLLEEKQCYKLESILETGFGLATYFLSVAIATFSWYECASAVAVHSVATEREGVLLIITVVLLRILLLMYCLSLVIREIFGLTNWNEIIIFL